MVIANDFEISYLLVAFALLGIILIGGLLDALHLRKLHPRLLGATLGALLGFALIEAVPLFT
jgi:UDP-N-acetylmuramyl pentapeptide phosphotransferase/UDP-N-acetylglucosamine-1-phosphate transferase